MAEPQNHNTGAPDAPDHFPLLWAQLNSLSSAFESRIAQNRRFSDPALVAAALLLHFPEERVNIELTQGLRGLDCLDILWKQTQEGLSSLQKQPGRDLQCLESWTLREEAKAENLYYWLATELRRYIFYNALSTEDAPYLTCLVNTLFPRTVSANDLSDKLRAQAFSHISDDAASREQSSFSLHTLEDWANISNVLNDFVACTKEILTRCSSLNEVAHSTPEIPVFETSSDDESARMLEHKKCLDDQGSRWIKTLRSVASLRRLR